jgi:hypothetical protein
MRRSLQGQRSPPKARVARAAAVSSGISHFRVAHDDATPGLNGP